MSEGWKPNELYRTKNNRLWRVIPTAYEYLLIDKEGLIEPTVCDEEWLINYLEGDECVDLANSEDFQVFMIFRLSDLRRIKIELKQRSIRVKI